MSNKKHIDRLFQEKFKDFDVKPDPKVWENIQGVIAPEKESNKRIVPIWFKYGSIAAVLLLFLTAGITLYNANFNTSSSIENNTPIISNVENLILKDTIAIVASSKNKLNPATDSSNKNNQEENISVLNNSDLNLANTNTKSKDNSTSKGKVSSATTRNKNYSTAASTAYKNSSIASTNKNKGDEKQNAVYASTIKTKPSNSGVAIISNTNVQKTANKEEDINTIINELKKDTFSTVSADQISPSNSETQTVLNDSLKINAIEDAIAKRENETDETSKMDNSKWTVNANVAPVYYNTLSEGSHIDSQFISNEKTGSVNTSYGINVGYALNDKLKIRSGINTLNLGYLTDEVVVYESVASDGRETNAFANLETSTVNGEQIAVVSGSSINLNQLESFSTETFKTSSLKQQINYIEIPVELEYAVVDKRFGVNIIGGMSTFILGDNEISTEIRGNATPLGEANNINDISFSTNIGLGLDYDFSKAFKINVEPTFKYQMNAFENTAGNFNPFILGVYTGFSYKF